jgi:hypothetical protein
MKVKLLGIMKEDGDGDNEELGVDAEIGEEADESEAVGDNEDDDDDDYDEGTPENSGSDVLRSPNPTDGEDDGTSTRADVTNLVQFNVADMRSPQLVVGNTFHDAAEFRKAVKQANIIKGKGFDIQEE